MSLKNKRHKRQRAENGQFVSSQEEQNTTSVMSDISEKAQSALSTVRETASSNKLVLGGIAAGIGVAAYVMGTERGRDITNRVGCTISDSVEGLRDRASGIWDQVVSGASELTDRFRGADQESSSSRRAA